MYRYIYKRITAQQSRVHSRRRLRIGCDGEGENSSRDGDSSEKEWATTGGGGVYLAAVIPFPTPERRKPMAWAAAGSIQGGAVQVESIPRPDLTGVRVYMEGGHTAARLRCAREFIIAAVAATTTTTQPMRRHYDVDDPRNHYGCCEPNLVEVLGIYSGVICIILSAEAFGRKIIM